MLQFLRPFLRPVHALACEQVRAGSKRTEVECCSKRFSIERMFISFVWQRYGKGGKPLKGQCQFETDICPYRERFMSYPTVRRVRTPPD